MSPTFRQFIFRRPLLRPGGPTRLDWFVAFGSPVVIGVGFALARLLFPSESAIMQMLTGVAGGTLTGLAFLYGAYRVERHDDA